MKTLLITFFCALISSSYADSPTRDEIVARMQPYSGNSSVPANDARTLQGRVFCGYQGWFTAPSDGANRGWAHYATRGRFEPGYCNIDLWPDVSGLDEDERFATPFRLADGSVAEVFSSHCRKTVLRHFQWMQQYGIDGVFVQRFAVETFAPLNLNHVNTVLMHCREGANLNGRRYCVMYDLSGLRSEQLGRVMDDWKLLVDRMKIGRDANDRAYLRVDNKPLVAVWGVGFNDGRQYGLDECAKLIRFLKQDPQYGGALVMLGVPTGWRTLNRDSVRDKSLHDIILEADIVSPWTVGRYATPEAAVAHAERDWAADLAWCREHGKQYMPVAFPGFSWHNMKPTSPFNQIPRLQGRFLWTQFVQAKKIGATMIYQAMFDELDEGTAIFKCSNSPPIGPSRFVTDENLPTDHYLWLTGLAGQILRGEIEASPAIPARK